MKRTPTARRRFADTIRAMNRQATGRYSNFILLEQRKFAFGYVPKVACTNWKCLFRLMNGADDWLSPRLAHDRQLSGLTILNPDHPGDREKLFSADAALYAMVRNPYSRILSAYLNKVMPRIESGAGSKVDTFQDPVAKIRKWSRRHGFESLDFRVFLLWLKHSGEAFTENEHFATQTSLLRTSNLHFDYIGRMENISSDARNLLDRMGCSEPFPSQQDVNFPPNHAGRKLGRYYGATEISLVRDIYKQDFEEFQYSSLLPA